MISQQAVTNTESKQKRLLEEQACTEVNFENVLLCELHISKSDVNMFFLFKRSQFSICFALPNNRQVTKADFWRNLLKAFISFPLCGAFSGVVSGFLGSCNWEKQEVIWVYISVSIYMYIYIYTHINKIHIQNIYTYMHIHTYRYTYVYIHIQNTHTKYIYTHILKLYM